MTIDQVQRWVMSFLVIAVSLFPTGALVAAIASLADTRRADAVVLLGAMGFIGIVCVVVVRIIHRRSPVSWFLLLGLLPAVVTGVIVL